MNQTINPTGKPTKFTNLADLDQFIHHRLRDENNIEHRCLIMGSVRRMKMYFERLEHQLQRIAASSTPIFNQHKRGIDLTNEGKCLWTVLRDANAEAASDLCEGRRLSPLLKLGLHLARKWGSRLRPYAVNNPNHLDVNQAYPQRMMAHIVRVIRKVCKSRKFRAWVNNDTRNAKQNYLSCANLIIDLLKKDSRLLILRGDFYFDGDARVFSESEAANRAYDKFLKNLSGNRIVPDVLAYIGKRENGLDKRIHFHVLVALAGDLHQNAYQLTEQLGRFWVHECVGEESLASHFNCWTRRHELEYSCLGLLHYADDRMLMGLRLALEYLCKEGAHVLIDPGMGRNLRKSIRPNKREGETRRGAPRKHGNDVHVAEQVLLTNVKVETRTWGVERAHLVK